MNDSTYVQLGQILKQTNRHQLLATKSKLFCSECKTLQLIIDYFPNRTALLECGHRRAVIDSAAVFAFEEEKARRPKGKLISKSSASAQLEVIYELPEEIAA